MMKPISLVVALLLLPVMAVALVGPGTYDISVTNPATDTFTVSTTPSRHMVSVYCISGTLVVQPQANGVDVVLIGGGTDAETTITIPSGATVPIYGVYDSLVFSSTSGTSTGLAWQYKE